MAALLKTELPVIPLNYCVTLPKLSPSVAPIIVIGGFHLALAIGIQSTPGPVIYGILFLLEPIAQRDQTDANGF